MLLLTSVTSFTVAALGKDRFMFTSGWVGEMTQQLKALVALQRTGFQFPAPTRGLISKCNPSFTGSNRHAPGTHTHTRADRTSIHRN